MGTLLGSIVALILPPHLISTLLCAHLGGADDEEDGGDDPQKVDGHGHVEEDLKDGQTRVGNLLVPYRRKRGKVSLCIKKFEIRTIPTLKFFSDSW